MNEKYFLIGGAIIIIALFLLILKVCGSFRAKVYSLFLKAEKEGKKGEKMDYVVEQIYNVLPYPLTIFINEFALRWLLQKMFDVVKDFLNDGKINGDKGE